MAKYRKLPVEIEAVQFTGHNGTEIEAWMIGHDARDHFAAGKPGTIVICTIEGEMTAGAGDWIIKGVAGEFYPCKPDIFEATYEKVEEG